MPVQAVNPNSTEEAPPVAAPTILSKRSWLRLGVGVALGIALLGIASLRVDLDDVWYGLRQARLAWVGAAFLSVLLTTLAKIGRWRSLFHAPRPRFSILTRALLAGQCTNALLPVRLGDVARAYQLGVEGRISKAIALGTVAAEKGFDVLFVLLSGGLALLLTTTPTGGLWFNLSLALFTTAGVLIVLVALAWPERFLFALLDRWASKFESPAAGRPVPRFIHSASGRMIGIARRMLLGMASLRTPRMALIACAWSTLIWVLSALTNYLLFLAFGFDLEIGAAILLMVILYVGSVPPSTPGKLGVFHTLTLLTLQALDVPRASGFAYATVLYFIVYLPQFVPGVFFLGTHLSADSKECTSSDAKNSDGR